MSDPDPDHDADRRARGLEMYHRVYGPDAVTFEEGEAEFFDVMVGQLFGEIWSRPALDVAERRLLVMGVLAAQHRFDILATQFRRCLETGELDDERVREAVIHLIQYVGHPSSGDLYRAGEDAIAAHAGTAP